MESCLTCGGQLPSGAHFCPACAAPVRSGSGPREERKLATILFGDLVGSTALADSEDPERTRLLLNRFYDAMAEEVAGGGGTLDKFIGDAVMAVFGAPSAQEDHAERALHVALAMMERMRELFGGAIALRIGVNTGELVVGTLRASNSFVTGDAVNVAARLEQGAAAGEILVGERTVVAVADAFSFDRPVSIAAKGKPQGVPCRRLIAAGQGGRSRGIAGLRRVFVDREGEREALVAAYSRALDRDRPQLVTVVGDAGVGKSSLVEELCAWLATRSPPPLVRVGHCRSRGQSGTLIALGDVVREHFGLLGSDGADAIRAALVEHEILGLTLGLEAPPDLHPLAVQDRLRRAWIGFLETIVSERPAVVLIEDLHWAEPALMALIDAAHEDVRGPLLILATTRPDLVGVRPGRGPGARPAETIRLDPLPEEHAAGMVDALVPARLPASVRDMVLQRGEGNPFFIEELLRTLIDRGVLASGAEGWIVREAPSAPIVPDSVHAVVAARIDLLDDGAKSALQAAAVIGRSFWSGPLGELLDGAAPDLGILQERGFVRRAMRSSMAGETEFRIAHAQIREVAYATLPKAKRARLHARFATWLERMADGGDEHAPLLAHHYAEAVRPEHADLAWPGEADELARLRERAVSWLRAAARLAVGRYEIEDARSLLGRAVALEARRDARVEIWRELAAANALHFDGTAFWEAIRTAIDLADAGPVVADLYAELAFQTLIRAGMWDSAPDAALVEEWVGRALELAPPLGSARARALIARCYSDYDKSPEMIAEATAIAEGLDDPVLLSYCLDLRGLRELAMGDARSSAGWHRRRVALAQGIDDPDHRADALASAIIPAVASGRMEEAREYARAQEDVTRALSPHHRLHGVSAILELEELRGDWEAVRRLEPRIEEAIAANARTPCLRNQRSLLVCALARAHLGEEAEARRLAAAAEERGVSGYGTVLDAPRLRLALQRGDLAAARSLLGQPGVRRTNWFYLSSVAAQLDGLAALGERELAEEEAARVRPGGYLEPFALRALGIVRGDGVALARAADRFAALGLPWHAARTSPASPSRSSSRR